MTQRQVIIITDGDLYARKTIDYLAESIGGTALTQLADNPTVYDPSDIVKAVYEAKSNPIYVLIDDAGISGVGAGEEVLLALDNDPNITIIGAVAVAAHTKNLEWSRVSFSIDQEGNMIGTGVDKEGVSIPEVGRINGDTVYLLDQIELPIVIGIGDIGKMNGYDDISKGSPITRKAIELIIEREEAINEKQAKK